MSYHGFGVNPLPMYGYGFGADAGGSVGPVIADAFQAVANSGIELSPPASVMFNVARIGIEASVNAALPALTDVALSVVPDIVLDMAASVVGDVAGAVPLVGAFIQGIVGTVTSMNALSQQEKAKLAQQCQSYIAKMAVKNSGSQLAGCLQCPADIFARSIVLSEFHNVPMRPLLGSMLMAVTEGKKDGEVADEFCATHTASACEYEKNYLSTWYKEVTDHARFIDEGGWSAAMGGSKKTSKLGIPLERRRLFQKVRKAIEASWGPKLPPGIATDGGMALWAVYMDMFLREFAEGHMNWAYAKELMGDVVLQDSNGHWYAETVNTAMDCQAAHFVKVLQKLYNDWNNTIHPYYSEGIKALEELKARSAEIQNLAQSKASARMSKISPAVLAKFAPSISKLLLVPKAPAKPTVAIKRLPTVKKKMSPAAAVGVGVGAGVVLLFFL